MSVCVSVHLCLSVIDSTNWYMGRKNKYCYFFFCLEIWILAWRSHGKIMELFSEIFVGTMSGVRPSEGMVLIPKADIFRLQHQKNHKVQKNCWKGPEISHSNFYMNYDLFFNYVCLTWNPGLSSHHTSGLIPDLHSGNKRRLYKVTPSFIGWAQT